ncbi:MAG: hypothetical protein NW223_02635 [Hyphomicrobiaceae bacterium]|nr:hypothetical protein [Hyphomicrobiaceae bacterium]
MSVDTPSANPRASRTLRNLAIVLSLFAAAGLALHWYDDRQRVAAQDRVVLTLAAGNCPDPRTSLLVRADNTSAWTAIDIEFVIEARLPGKTGNLVPRRILKLDETLRPGQSAGQCLPYPDLEGLPEGSDRTRLQWRVERTSVTFLH